MVAFEQGVYNMDLQFARTITMNFASDAAQIPSFELAHLPMNLARSSASLARVSGPASAKDFVFVPEPSPMKLIEFRVSLA